MIRKTEKKERKGILLAGGNGTRLYPITKSVSKHLLPIYDKPMIYYSFSMLLLAGIREILIVCREKDLDNYTALFGDGREYGLSIEYSIQNTAEGIPQALTLGEKFLSGSDVCLVLADNILYGSGLQKLLYSANHLSQNSIFIQEVKDPSRFGIANIVDDKIIGIVEKPRNPISNNAITGVYFLNNEAVKIAKKLSKSSRGEFEIVDLLNQLNSDNSIKFHRLNRGIMWFDAGTPKSLLECSEFVSAVEAKQLKKIGAIEEIAYVMGYINRSEFDSLVSKLPAGEYKSYLETSFE